MVRHCQGTRSGVELGIRCRVRATWTLGSVPRRAAGADMVDVALSGCPFGESAGCAVEVSCVLVASAGSRLEREGV